MVIEEKTPENEQKEHETRLNHDDILDFVTDLTRPITQNQHRLLL
jgi:hypothetical protein